MKKTEAVANKLKTARFLVLGNCGMCGNNCVGQQQCIDGECIVP